VIAYTVSATFPDEATAAEYVAWLHAGHLEQVLAGGAVLAGVLRQTDPGNPITVEARYTFVDRRALDRYVREVAPGLRAEGLAKFPPNRGVSFYRRIGEFVGPVLKQRGAIPGRGTS
jgi:hypothetical protein